MNQFPENTHPKVTYNWLYFFPAIILAIIAVTFIPVQAYGGLFGKAQGIIAIGITLLPFVGVLIGTAVSYFLGPKKLNFHIGAIIGGLLGTFIACLIIGKPSGVPDYEVVVAMPVMFFMLSIPAWAMWGAVAFFRAFRGDK